VSVRKKRGVKGKKDIYMAISNIATKVFFDIGLGPQVFGKSPPYKSIYKI
jgi:hypothetical protein